MSANASISEGGKGRSFGPVKCLMVEGDNGEFYPWYPEADRALDSLSVDKNGIYRASDKGVYGWGRIAVNVQADSVTGRDPDTGEEKTVTVNPETGELVETVVPTQIRVITPPTNPYGVYVDGQTITKDGMVVKAYDNNGDEMQIVPIGQITINPTVAVYDPTADTGRAEYEGEEYLYRNGGVIRISTPNPNMYEEYAAYDGNGPFYAVGIAWTSPNEAPNLGRGGIICSPNHFEATENGRQYDYSIVHSYTLDSKTVYYAGSLAYQGALNPSVNAPVNPVGEDSYLTRRIAWIVCYGTRTEGGNQTITVSWPRPGDGAILETTFEITVGPHSGQGDD